MEEDSARVLLRALSFAAERHRDQRRKGADRPPFINHAIEVASILASVGGVTDATTLQAAVLHDTLEDTETTAAEIETVFGPAVRRIVEEVTDDTQLTRGDRRRMQIETASELSTPAKLIRLADKISNVRAIVEAPPVDWSVDRRLDYVTWSAQVIAGCRGYSDPLERAYDEVLGEAIQSLRGLTS